MRRICIFVPAAALTAPALATTATAHPTTTAPRDTARPAGTPAGRASLQLPCNGGPAGDLPAFARGGTRQPRLASARVAIESVGSRA